MIPAPTPETWPASPTPSPGLPTTSAPPNPAATGDPPRSPRQRTVARTIRRKPGPKSKPRADRRLQLMRKFGVSAEQVADAPQIAPLLKQNGVRRERFVEVLRCDREPESLAFVQFWDGLTASDRHDITLEVAALAASLTPRRLWELYHGATLMQAKESVAVMMAEALPAIMRRALSRAKTAKGDRCECRRRLRASGWRSCGARCAGARAWRCRQIWLRRALCAGWSSHRDGGDGSRRCVGRRCSPWPRTGTARPIAGRPVDISAPGRVAGPRRRGRWLDPYRASCAVRRDGRAIPPPGWLAASSPGPCRPCPRG